MISPWTIYWITRLDVVGEVLQMCMTMSVLVAITTTGLWILNNCTNHFDSGNPEVGKRWRRGSLASIAASVLFIAATIALPTTKQMAAIYIIPAIANNEQIQAEASELYDLAKDYLKSLAEEEK